MVITVTTKKTESDSDGRVSAIGESESGCKVVDVELAAFRPSLSGISEYRKPPKTMITI